MAKIKSSKKRIKTNERNRIQNQSYNSQVKTFTKQYLHALKQYETSSTKDNRALVSVLLALTYSKIDKAKKRHIFHKNTAARKKAKLGKAFSKIIYIK